MKLESCRELPHFQAGNRVYIGERYIGVVVKFNSVTDVDVELENGDIKKFNAIQLRANDERYVDISKYLQEVA